MFTNLKRIGLASLAAVGVTVGLAPTELKAQLIRPGFRIQSGNGISLQQAAFNQGMTGSAFPFLSPPTVFPYANPLVNPYVNPLVNPFANPALNPGINPSALANYFSPQAAFNSNPLVNPYTVFGNPYTNFNPYLTAGTGLANPYTASLTSTPYAGAGLGADPYSAYGVNNPYNSPYYGYGESPIGGYLRGTADIISSQGKWMMDSEKARVIREQVQREKIENRKRLFDEYLYERKNTPTFEEERQRFLAMELSRSLNDPPTAEILSGQALNTILADLAKVSKERGELKGPQIPVDEDVLAHINVTSGAGSAGLLKKEGQINWPLPLRTDEFKQEREVLNDLAPLAIRQAIGGRVEANVLKDMNAAAARLRQKLADNIRDMTPNQYMEANRFLGYLDDSLRTLGRPDAGDYFAQKSGYAPRGKSIGELVRHMLSKGLTFAPAVTGDEAAYQAVHRGLVAYDSGVKAQLAAER
jgi:hypothetical protein